MNLKRLFEADEEEFFDDTEEIKEEPVDIEDNDEVNDINEMVTKTISFPIIIEGFDADDQPVSMDLEQEKNYASDYGDLVIDNIEQNKKFILSALDIYDFECYFKNYDSNSFVNFTVSLNEDIDNDILINCIKRYFNVTMETRTTDDGDFSLNPVLDNKFIRIS